MLSERKITLKTMYLKIEKNEKIEKIEKRCG